jgi:predicted RNA-binding Zn ribbon-like protein
VRALREFLQAGLAGAAAGRRPPDPFIRHLNRLSRGAPRYVELRWPRGSAPGVRVRARSRTRGATALAAVARSAIELLGGPARHRLRRCSGPRCVLFFLASDLRQTWCSGACGNRARVARYQAARRARRAGSAIGRKLPAAGGPRKNARSEGGAG